jgi:dephospho-CoA kinase
MPRPDHPAVTAARQFVFGYGSLAAEVHDGDVATLRGHRRAWGVAMDNRRDLPGYKSYRLRADASRPALYVAFLDIERHDDAVVTGVCTAVGERELDLLDRRERNYERVDVTDWVSGGRERVWAYRGSDGGRARLREGLAAGRAAVSRDYLEAVLSAIAAFAPHEARGVERAPEQAGLVVLDLERIDIPLPSGRRTPRRS